MGNIFLTIITILTFIFYFISVLMYMRKDTVQHLALYTISSIILFVLGIIIYMSKMIANQSYKDWIAITVIFGINALIGLFSLILDRIKVQIMKKDANESNEKK